jgi:hypothetical protein
MAGVVDRDAVEVVWRPLTWYRSNSIHQTVRSVRPTPLQAGAQHLLGDGAGRWRTGWRFPRPPARSGGGHRRFRHAVVDAAARWWPGRAGRVSGPAASGRRPARAARAAAPGRFGRVEDVGGHGRFDGVDLGGGGARDLALALALGSVSGATASRAVGRRWRGRQVFFPLKMEKMPRRSLSFAARRRWRSPFFFSTEKSPTRSLSRVHRSRQ